MFSNPFLFRTAEEASVVGWKLHEGDLTGFDGVHVIGFVPEPNALFLKTKASDISAIKNMKIRAVGGTMHHGWKVLVPLLKH